MDKSFFIEESGFPALPQMMLATVEALRSLGGSAAIDELNDAVTEREGVTEVEQSYLMPWAEISAKLLFSMGQNVLKRGGALENSARRVWNLTEIGYSIDE